MINCVFYNKNLNWLSWHIDELKEVFEETGILYFPGMLRQERVFDDYISDLYLLARSLSKETGSLDLTESRLHNYCKRMMQYPETLKPLYDIGTRPIKLLSGNKLKFDLRFERIAKVILGKDTLLATPILSDTLHVMLPGEAFAKYYLPIHQDFPYLMQSPEQLTFWLNLTEYEERTGGVEVLVGSHKKGIRKTHKTESGHYEALPYDDEKFDDYERLQLKGGFGDLAIMNSLSLHKSIPNTSKDGIRLTQLFRYSNLLNIESLDYNCLSAVHAGKGLSFVEGYPEYMVSNE